MNRVSNYLNLSIIAIQCVLLSLLWAVWALPGTIIIRNFCLIAGTGLGIYQLISSSPQIDWPKARLSLVCVALFFTWILWRLFFHPNNPDLQWYEMQSVWKRSALAFIFGTGLTFGLSKYPEKKYLSKIIFIGLCCPLIIYYLKYICTFLLPQGFVVPEWLILYYGSAPYYVPKIAYVFFCIPLFAVTLAEFLRSSEEKNLFANFLNIMLMVAISGMFLMEHNKNGALYEVILILLGLLLMLKRLIKKKVLSWKWFVLFLFMLTIGFLTVQKNTSLRHFYADYKITSQVDRYQSWKNNGPLPLNEYGETASGTNYDRISWAIVGSRLLVEHPLGYGVVEKSFGHLAKQYWPDTTVTQTHSGLLDLMLGIGIPGALLILLSFVFALHKGSNFHPALKERVTWIVTSVCLLFLTTEVSQRIYIEALFLLLGCSVGLAMANSQYSPQAR
jgi:hypothetical protein